jgi:hypothetical protein
MSHDICKAWSVMLARVESKAGHHSHHQAGADPGRGRPHLRPVRGHRQQADGPLPGRGRGRLRTPIPGPEDLAERRHRRSRRVGAAPAQGTPRGRSRRRSRHPGLASSPTPRDHAVEGHDPPDPDPARRSDPGAEEEAQVVLHPVPGRDAQRVLAVRLHPLPTHRHHGISQGRRDHHLAR